MAAKFMCSQRSAQVSVRRRCVECSCAPDVQRPSLDSKVLEPAPYRGPSSFTKTDVISSTEAKHADEWLGSSPILSVPSTGGTTLVEDATTVPLLPKSIEEAVEKESEGLGDYLMRTAPVRYGYSLLQGFPYEWTTVN